jgi:hypothetical protein
MAAEPTTATIVFESGQIALVQRGRWDQSRETFERLGYLTPEEREDMWAVLADFEGRWFGDLVAADAGDGRYSLIGREVL